MTTIIVSACIRRLSNNVYMKSHYLQLYLLFFLFNLRCAIVYMKFEFPSSPCSLECIFLIQAELSEPLCRINQFVNICSQERCDLYREAPFMLCIINQSLLQDWPSTSLVTLSSQIILICLFVSQLISHR